MNKIITKRIKWLDLSRGLAFLMVIYSHLDYCDDSIMRFFSPVFLSTFFFVSGYLYKTGENFLNVFEQRTRTLLIPFLIIGMTDVLLSQIISFKSVSLSEALEGLLLQRGNAIKLWFIAAIYIYSVLFYFIAKFRNKLLIIFALILYMGNWIYKYQFNGVELFWHVDNAGYALYYMSMGLCYKENEDYISKHLEKWWIIAFISVFYVLFIYFSEQKYSYTSSKYCLDGLFVTLTGIIILLYICKHANYSFSCTCFVGANSLLYFAIHGKVYSVLQMLPRKLLLYNDIGQSVCVDLLFSSLLIVVGSFIIAILVLFINKFASWITGKGYKLYKFS